MSERAKKIIYVATWLMAVAIGPYFALQVTPIKTLTTPVLVLNFFQRITALSALSLLFLQIVVGANMTGLTEKLGGWVFKFHVFGGAFTYALVLSHPILFVVIRFLSKGVLDPFYVFTDVCLLCSEPIELWYTLGRLSVWFVTLAVIAAVLRKEAWWRVHWRKFHVLNYIAFYLVAFHGVLVGTDVANTFFIWIVRLMFGVVTIFFVQRKIIPIVGKVFPQLIKK